MRRAIPVAGVIIVLAVTALGCGTEPLSQHQLQRSITEEFRLSVYNDPSWESRHAYNVTVDCHDGDPVVGEVYTGCDAGWNVDFPSYGSGVHNYTTLAVTLTDESCWKAEPGPTYKTGSQNIINGAEYLEACYKRDGTGDGEE